MDEPTTVGERIAYWRNRRGLTQEVLAGLVGRSASWMTKVERGEHMIDRVSVILALSRVLKVEPGKLIGSIDLPVDGGAPNDPPRGIPALRHALLGVPDREPPTATELRADVDQVALLRTNGSCETRSVVLPSLLVAGRAAADHEIAGAWECLARLYHMASGLCRRVGDLDLALLAADRGVTAAQRSGDTLMLGSARRLLAFAMMREGWLDDTGRVCSDAADALAPNEDTSLEGWSVWGSLLLTEAVAAARKDDLAAARRALRDARAAGDRVGPGRNDYSECFGPANVGAHEVAIALESGDAVEALRVADRTNVDELPMAGRRADVLIDVAHAHGLRQDDAAVVGALLEAEYHAPEMVRYSGKARELVISCLRRERKSRTPGLRRLAERVGVAD